MKFSLFLLILILAVIVNPLIGQRLSGRRIRQTNKSQFNPQKSYDFSGKVVLITGSSSGIGAQIAKQFCQLGANVVITSRNATEISRVANECQKLSPKKLKPLEIKADLTKDNEINDLLMKTIDAYGKLDVLVNNAGISAFAAITDKNFMSIFDRTMAINLRPSVQLSHLAVPYLAKTNGTIISTSSVLSMVPFKNTLAYDVSKAGVDMMTRVLALELGPNIRVNAVNPGYINTGIIHPGMDPAIIESMNKQFIRQTPLKRAGRALDIAQAVVFLASDQASFITGANLVIDGGSMWNSSEII